MWGVERERTEENRSREEKKRTASIEDRNNLRKRVQQGELDRKEKKTRIERKKGKKLPASI